MENIPKKFEMGDRSAKWIVGRQEDGTYTWLNTKYNFSSSGHSEAEVRKWLNTYKITKIYEEEKPATRKYPDKFTLKALTKDTTDYEVVYDAASGRYKITFNGRDYHYDEDAFDLWIKKGTHKMIPTEYNGVDADGNALNFTPDMLKPFMRVVTRNGQQWIVAPYEECPSKVVLVSVDEAWCTVGESGSLDNEFDNMFDVVEVHSNTFSPWKMLTVGDFGELIWKRQEVKPVDESITKRLEWLQVHIDAVKENMESLQAEYDELKQAVK